MKTSNLEKIFANLKAELVPMVRAISEKLNTVDDSVLHRHYDGQKQWNFGIEVLKRFGYDFERGRQDKSVHPFTTSFSINDVRITTRVDENFLPSALFGTLHEGGHALYEQGISQALERTPLGAGASLGIVPSKDAEGVLQDVHWSNGLIGYFPTYSLGNLISVQLFEQAKAENRDIPGQIEWGDFSGLLEWLRTHVHRHGRKFLPMELVERATGSHFQAEPYIDYLKNKYSEIYLT